MANGVVELNQDIGYYLLKFIDGLDTVNFIEAVDYNHQPWSIATTSDHYFIEKIKVFCEHETILPSHALFEDFANKTEIDDEQLTAVSNHYSNVVHPCFTVSGFEKLCETYRTPLFNCYSRLLPFNTIIYDYSADFGLLDYHWYGHTIGSERVLIDHERFLFRVNKYFNKHDDQKYSSNMTFLYTIKKFKENLATRFSSNVWLGSIDFSKWVIVGGCVLNALCETPFLDTRQQNVDLVYYVHDISDFKKSIDNTIDNLNKTISQDIKDKVKVERVLGTPNFSVFLSCDVRLNFTWAPIGKSKYPLSHILHSFDMDICQIAFNGAKIISTFSFLQALATRTFIVYSLHARSPKVLCTRIEKYCNRGFNLLVPTEFDGDFDSLMAQEEIPLYRLEHQQYIDDDGETRIAIKEFRRPFLENIDTFRLQEKFMNIICPHLLQYE